VRGVRGGEGRGATGLSDAGTGSIVAPTAMGSKVVSSTKGSFPRMVASGSGLREAPHAEQKRAWAEFFAPQEEQNMAMARFYHWRCGYATRSQKFCSGTEPL
jgi:hypothetical protein